MAPLTYQQQAYAILSARDYESAIAATNRVTLPRAIKFLQAMAEHVMRHPGAMSVPDEVIEQLRLFATLNEPTHNYRVASDLTYYNKIMRHFHKSDADPIALTAKIAELACLD